jgi:hypothetical protein
MASKIFNKKLTAGQGRVDIDGSFAPAGTGAVTSVNGAGFSVARTGVGVFEITFVDKYVELVAANATVQLNALADTDAVIGPWTASTKKLQIFVKTAGVAADIAANANNRIHFQVTFRNSKLATR